MITWQKKKKIKVKRMMLSLVGFPLTLCDLVYSLFSLPLSLINVISHNVSEDFLLNCFVKVDGHQNIPRAKSVQGLLVQNMCLYKPLYGCKCECVCGRTTICTTILMCIGPHMYSCESNVYFRCRWPFRTQRAQKQFTLSKRTLSLQLKHE